MKRSPVHMLTGGRQGSILIEVLAAMILLAVILGPLIERLEAAGEQVRRFRAAHGTSAVSSGTEEQRGAWSWGPQVEAGSWQAGQELTLRLRFDPAAEMRVGLWADGWYLGETPIATDGSVVVKAGLLGACEGQELVARVRAGAGVWGPPWRSVVPDALGATLPPLVAPAGYEPVGDDTEGAVVVHPGCLANPVVGSSEGGLSVGRDSAGLHLFVDPTVEGTFRLRLNGFEQSLRKEAGRALDLYH